MGENDTSWVAGIDGCRAGWVVVLVEHKTGVVRNHHIRLCSSFADVLAIHPKPRVIAIDIPIGLLDRPEPGGRECDWQARKLLSRRASSIFLLHVAPDDIIAVCALAWTALCISSGQANRVPDRRQIDHKGLRMEIWFPSVLVR